MSLAQRIQRNPLLLLIVGAVLILSAAVLVWLNISARQAPQRTASEAARSAGSQTATQSVLFATHAIGRGSVIAADDIALRGVVSPAPAGALGDMSLAVGRVALVDILPGQLVLGNAISTDKVAAGVSALVGKGERAFSVRVAEDQIVGGFLRINDRVDVYVTLPDSVYPQATATEGKGSDQSKSTLLLQNVNVVAVGEKLATNGPDAINGVRTVTLEVAPAAVARLALADRLGKVALAIRNPSDNESAPETTVGLSDLANMATEGRVEPVAARKAEAPVSGHRITIYSGATTTTVTTAR